MELLRTKPEDVATVEFMLNAFKDHPDLIQAWFFDNFETFEQVKPWIDLVVPVVPIDEFFERFRPGETGEWWEDKYTNDQIRAYAKVIRSLPLSKVTVGVYCWLVKTCFSYVREKMHPQLIPNILNLSKAEQKKIVDLYNRLDRKCFFGESLDFKLKLGLPDDGHPHWGLRSRDTETRESFTTIESDGAKIETTIHHYVEDDGSYDWEVFRIVEMTLKSGKIVSNGSGMFIGFFSMNN